MGNTNDIKTEWWILLTYLLSGGRACDGARMNVRVRVHVHSCMRSCICIVWYFLVLYCIVRACIFLYCICIVLYVGTCMRACACGRVRKCVGVHVEGHNAAHVLFQF